MRHEELTEEDDDPEEELILQRIKKKDFEPCQHCKRDYLKPNDLVLSIEFSKFYIALCEKCETELLSRMLSNYLRRCRRRKMKAEDPVLSILEDPADDSDIEFSDLYQDEDEKEEAA